MLLPILIVQASHARATMRVEVARAAAGRPFLAAVEVQTDPDWHIYWNNPGDSGIPTQIDWRAPKGWRVEPLEFPTPSRFEPGGIAAYGYEGKTLFLARVTPNAKPGALSANVKWLVCSNACIPGEAAVSAKVPVGPSASPSGTAAQLRSAYASLPTTAKGWAVRAVKGSKEIVLTATPPKGVAVGSSVEFFPENGGVIDQAKPALATSQGSGLVFKLPVSPFPEPQTSLKGLLVVSGARRQAYRIAPKIEKGS